MADDIAAAIAAATRQLLEKPAASEATARDILKAQPGLADARLLLGSALRLQGKFAEARAMFEPLRSSPAAPARLFYELGSVLTRTGEWRAAVDCHREFVTRFPQDAQAWVLFGHSLKTVGQTDECLAAYRRAIALRSDFGEAYWSIANLKTAAFRPEEIAAMETQLARRDLGADARAHFEFALGKALEDSGDYATSFAHYAKGNALRKASSPYSADGTHTFVERVKAAFSPELFARLRGIGSPAPDPIFIVGLPRSGSTLVEQMLASHSAVEATMELHDVAQLARELGTWEPRTDGSSYPECLGALLPARVRALGEAYVERTRVHRKRGRPFFIDKMPHNFLHIGLIHLMLPNAKIIDVRRNPLACGFSLFRQNFARGAAFSYDLESIGRYYSDYVALMEHWDSVLPGRVHHLRYEQLIADPETDLRRLLAYCGLPFEPACLSFHETDRGIATSSSEQVRKPIFRDGLDRWRAYEQWLAPLKAALTPGIPQS